LARDPLKVMLVGAGPDARERLGRALSAGVDGQPAVLLQAVDLGQARSLLAGENADLLVLDLAGLQTAPSLHALADHEAILGALADLRQSEARHRSIVENQTGLVCRFTPDGRLTFANRAFRRYFRWAQDETLLGHNIFSGQSEQELSQTRAQLAALTPEHPLARIQKPYLTRSGEERWQQWTNLAIFDEAGTLAEYQSEGLDITERKRMEEALRVVEANLRSLIIANADAMIVVDLAGRMQFLNPAAEALLGRRASELAGSPFAFDLTPNQRQEVHLVDGQGQDLVAEMRVAEVKWQDQPAYLASLRDITELVSLREELRSLSLVDELTGLFNRRGFVTLAQQQLKTAQRMRRRMRLFFMDLDDLKTINDNLGHRLGDQALLAAAAVLRATFRESDILARVGGDEFVALTMEAEEDSSGPLGQRINANVQEFQEREKPMYRLSLSMGTALYDPDQPTELEELLYQADVQMYQNKRRKQVARG
jgi:diguanylate cyclase (GGDEF)-like protein/PAS domain S-box-containing protein